MDKELIFVLFVTFAVLVASKTLPSDDDYYEYWESNVKISVGEGDFLYVVQGVTYSKLGIRVAGSYYDNKDKRCGDVLLYLVAAVPIYFVPERDVKYNDDFSAVSVTARSYGYNSVEFRYTITVPRKYGVDAFGSLDGIQHNNTAIRVEAPSFSNIFTKTKCKAPRTG